MPVEGARSRSKLDRCLLPQTSTSAMAVRLTLMRSTYALGDTDSSPPCIPRVLGNPVNSIWRLLPAWY